MKLSSICRCTMLLALPLTAASCGSERPITAKVSGVVEYDGKPLTDFQHGAVAFTPIGGRRATGAINPKDGSFSLSTFGTADGAIAGPAKVTVSATTDDSQTRAPDKYQNMRWVIPKNFADSDLSRLTCEVEPGKRNVFRIKISPDGTGTIEPE